LIALLNAIRFSNRFRSESTFETHCASRLAQTRKDVVPSGFRGPTHSLETSVFNQLFRASRRRARGRRQRTIFYTRHSPRFPAAAPDHRVESRAGPGVLRRNERSISAKVGQKTQRPSHLLPALRESSNPSLARRGCQPCRPPLPESSGGPRPG
jgi:hypothetical protein